MILGWIKLKILSLIQDKLVFKPVLKNIEAMVNPADYGLKAAEKFITTEDGIDIQIWEYLSSEFMVHDINNSPLTGESDSGTESGGGAMSSTIIHQLSTNLPPTESLRSSTPPQGGSYNSILLIFHGNTGHFGDVGKPKKGEEYDRRYRLKMLGTLENKNINYLAVSPRGYGKSDGKPSEDGFIKDISAVLDYAENSLKVSPDKLTVFGESMGASLAFIAGEIMAERQTPISRVIAVAAFQNIEKKVMELHPDLEKHNISKHLRHPMDNMLRITKQHKDTHIFLIHPGDDETTPLHHSRFLEQIARDAGMSVSYHELANAGHISWDVDDILQIIND